MSMNINAGLILFADGFGFAVLSLLGAVYGGYHLALRRAMPGGVSKVVLNLVLLIFSATAPFGVSLVFDAGFLRDSTTQVLYLGPIMIVAFLVLLVQFGWLYLLLVIASGYDVTSPNLHVTKRRATKVLWILGGIIIGIAFIGVVLTLVYGFVDFGNLGNGGAGNNTTRIFTTNVRSKGVPSDNFIIAMVIVPLAFAILLIIFTILYCMTFIHLVWDTRDAISKLQISQARKADFEKRYRNFLYTAGIGAVLLVFITALQPLLITWTAGAGRDVLRFFRSLIAIAFHGLLAYWFKASRQESMKLYEGEEEMQV